MVQIAVMVLTTLALIVAAFLNFTPNFTRVVESDAQRVGYEYANTRSLEEIQLRVRAGTLTPASGFPVFLTDPGFFYKDNSREEKMVGQVTAFNALTGDITLQVDRQNTLTPAVVPSPAASP